MNCKGRHDSCSLHERQNSLVIACLLTKVKGIES